MRTEYDQKGEFLEGILNLIQEFNSRQLNYCHWKSNIHLDSSLKGTTDLDLLVDESQEQLFEEILLQHDLKSILPSGENNYPTIEHFLGIDKTSGNLFHLHVHYELILGEQFIKNYHLPVEKAMLDDRRYSLGNIAVPCPDRELVVLIIRSLLKYRDRDVIKDIFSIKSPGIPGEIRREIKELLSQTTFEQILDTVSGEMNVVSPDLVFEYLDILEKSPRNGWKLFRLRSQLRQELSGFQLQARWKASISYYQILIKRNFPQLFSQTNKKHPAHGGQNIAFLGADGAGKTTLIRSIQKWLSWKLDVKRYYMGSQEPSNSTSLARFAAHATSRMYHYMGKKTGYHSWVAKLFRLISTFTRNVYDLGIANDRYHRYLAGRKKASAGTIVIYDRYPIREVHQLMPVRPMDGPRINKRGENTPGKLSGFLSIIEEDLYHKIKPPDYLFILNVSPEISKMRKPDHNIQVMKSKSQVIKSFNREKLHFTEIDADETMDEVLIKTRLQLWEVL
jgi:thymidylate kinase